MYSYRIEQAIRAAAILHKDQLRKGSMPLPYITHLIAVSLILRDYTNDEDTIIAALLHDTLEDTDYTPEEIQEDFGGDVRDIVESLTEPHTKEPHQTAWRVQKDAYIKQLRGAREEALLIACADKIHNMRTVVEEYYEDHSRFLADFRGSIEDRLVVYEELSQLLNKKVKNAIIEEFNQVYSEYKQFIDDAKKSEIEQE